jgi:hypothetical protein
MSQDDQLELQWCSELHFVGQKSSPFKGRVVSFETFPGHEISINNFVRLRTSDESDQQYNNETLRIGSLTKVVKNQHFLYILIVSVLKATFANSASEHMNYPKYELN